LAEKDFLELIHAGVGEQQRRVIARNERGGADDSVASFSEEVEESLADLVAGHGCFRRNLLFSHFGDGSCIFPSQ
jgi:hypothetical protein